MHFRAVLSLVLILCLGQIGHHVSGQPETKEPPKLFEELKEGYYRCAGEDGGGGYKCLVSIRKLNQKYSLRYYIGDGVSGVGMMRNGVLAVSWKSPNDTQYGVTVYQITKTGLSGSFITNTSQTGVPLRESMTFFATFEPGENDKPATPRPEL